MVEMDYGDYGHHSPDDVKLVQEAAAVAVSWVLGGELTRRQSDLLAIGYHMSGHQAVGDSGWVYDWERALRVVLDGATDSEVSRRLVTVAKETALRDMRNHLHFVVEMDWWFRSEDWPGYHEILRRIIAADGPEAQETTGPAGAEL
ncbi:hypothetical protein AB0B78_36485 [Streptomyces sp. NPDC040724]|uniref:hypothetical protein n=1 Tax=Streptomyces sp. NPDC040724 TaxID=3155612 RepID=UPI00340A18AE